jgi:uncharacterized protein (DUF58 family)
MLFGLFMEAYMHDFNLVYITLFFVFSLAFSAGPLGVLNLGNLQMNFRKQGRFFAQQKSNIQLEVSNPSQMTSWSITLHKDADNFTHIPYIKAESKEIVSLTFLPTKRGMFRYEGCYLQSKYPLSTARLTKSIDVNYEGIIYPEPKGISLENFLNAQETHIGEEKEFDGLSAYDGTQKISHLHWASVAKGELSVKRFVKETEVSNLNFIFENIKGDTEVRLSQLTLWVLACERQRLPFQIQLPNKKLDSYKESIDEILETLARY